MSKLFHVTCTLPNASLLINGIEFVRVDKETIITANPVEQHIADHFGAIDGYGVSEFSEEDQEAILAAERLAEQARLRAVNQAKRASAARAGKAAPQAPEAAEPAAEPEKAADAGEGEGQGDAGEGEPQAKGEAETLF